MSARRAKLPSPSKRRQRSNQSNTSGLFLISEAPRVRLAPTTRGLGVPRHPQHISVASRRYTQVRSTIQQQPFPTPSHDPDNPFLVDEDTDFPQTVFEHAIDGEPNSNARKRQRQWWRWQDEVIPSLLGPFLAVLRQTQSLRDPPKPPESRLCLCGNGRSLKVICVYFDRTVVSFPPAPSLLKFCP